MADTQIAIRRRIRSVNNTLQITRAMELVATSKLQRQKNRMLKGKVYADTLREMIGKALSSLDAMPEKPVSPYLEKRDFDRPLVIVIGSDEGMCGAFNSNLEKFVLANVRPEDRLVLCGDKVIRAAERNGLQAYTVYHDFSHADETLIRHIGEEALKMFREHEISEIRVIYVEYINAASFEPTMTCLLPIERDHFSQEEPPEILFEPDAEGIVNELIPMYVRNVFYSLVLRSKTSEYASRRLAMETASDNAVELKEELTLSYNKARQAAITQEITEISVSGMSRE